MAETLLDLRGMPKREAYEAAHTHITTILEGIDDPIAEMATISSVLHHGFGFLWTGFYRVVAPNYLRVGPYQGTLGCLDIAFGRGVCGTAAAERRTVIVHDVTAIENHIACDARARSEIVVPVLDAGDKLIAVLDVDADVVAAFDNEDQRGLERIVARFARSQP